MIVRFTRAARGELREIHRHIAADNLQAADRLLEEIIRQGRDLATNPNRGVVVGSVRDVTLRKLIASPYLVLYSVSADAVRIHRVVHGARSPKAILKNLDPFA